MAGVEEEIRMTNNPSIYIRPGQDSRLAAMYPYVDLQMSCPVHPTCNCGECVVRRRNEQSNMPDEILAQSGWKLC